MTDAEKVEAVLAGHEVVTCILCGLEQAYDGDMFWCCANADEGCYVGSYSKWPSEYAGMRSCWPPALTCNMDLLAGRDKADRKYVSVPAANRARTAVDPLSG